MTARRTFAIISHPDAGKTTVTEKLLLLGNAIQLAGTVKARKSDRHATSDWMAMERERGISVTTSVMQFEYADRVVNLLDTPGHEDFSEDTYRTLTAVDSALMVIDAAKGVEPRTIKLMEVCRLRDTPILTFINKLDREIREPIALLDEIENVLGIQCAPMTWPIGSGRYFRGVYDFEHDRIHCYATGHGHHLHAFETIDGLDSEAARELLGTDYASFIDQIDLVRVAGHTFDRERYLKGEVTPVFFGTALGNFGVAHMLDCFVENAPAPQPRATHERVVESGRRSVHGLRVQDSGEHGPKAPRPDCVSAHLLGAIPAGHADASCPHRQGRQGFRRGDVHGRRADARRRGVRRATSSACTTTVRCRSAIRSPKARTCASSACRTSRRSCSGACAFAIH